MLQVGIVGLPNVGKSTLFNALLRRQQALVANYPFATIEPNVGVIPVPDERLDKLADVVAKNDGDPSTPSGRSGLASPGFVNVRPPIVPTTIRFVDIAGLVKGAAQGAGLGNKFLSHIREVDLICEVVRAFPDGEIIREGSTEPESDIEVIKTELILADLQSLNKIQDSGSKIQVKNQEARMTALEKLLKGLDQGKLASEVELTEEEREAAKELQLLTAKKFIYVLNVNTATNWAEALKIKESLETTFARGGLAKGKGTVCVIDAKLEAELAILSPDEQEEYLESLGVSDSGVNSLIRMAYSSLDLISFLTAPDSAKASPGKGWEVRAWTITRGTKAPQAAGVIHTDFEKGFIKAEVIDYEDFVRYNGREECKRLGKVRFEGKEYEMKDGDVVEFKVNA